MRKKTYNYERDNVQEERTFRKITFVPKAINYLSNKLREEKMTPIERVMYAKYKHVTSNFQKLF